MGCAPSNLFENGSLEEGKDPWFWLTTPNWRGFMLSDRHAVDGRYSIHLPLRADAGNRSTMIFGAIQEVAPPVFPGRISGYYRVENWNRGTPKQYVQFVVIVWNDPAVRKWPNIQIRYILSGLRSPPFTISNGKMLFLGPEEPVQGAWIPFERDLVDDFKNYWGHVPEGFTKIRILFEVRYDGRRPEDEAPHADVYFDQLFLGKGKR